MALSDMFSGFGSDPWANLSHAMFGTSTGAGAGGNPAPGAAPTDNGIMGAITGLVGGAQSAGTNNQINQNVQAGLGQNQSALQAQIDALNGQITQNRQQAQDMYTRSLGNVNTANQGLQGTIGTQTANLNALSDPNSPYMQMARQNIERQDAAAGRNSQWGSRETQLAGTLADYVGKYSPGIQQSITGAQNQINLNNQGLASLYSTANQPADRNTLAQIQAIQQQIANANAQNAAGRQAANAANNGTLGMINNAGKAIGGVGSLLGNLFGGNSNAAGISSDFMGNQTPTYGSNWMNQGLTLNNGTGGYAAPTMPLTGDVQSALGQNNNFGSNPYDFTSSMGGSSTDPWALLNGGS